MLFMQTGMGAHIDEEALEKYSMGNLPETDLARLEEHLLVCPGCQDRLKELDNFLTAIRTVGPRLRAQRGAKRHPWWQLFPTPAFPRLALAGSLALLVLAFVVGRVWNLRSGPDLTPATVVLQLARGPDAAVETVAPAGQPLILETDVSQLTGFPAYGVEIVTSNGERLFRSSATATEGRMRVPVSRAFRAGSYFVRLYSPAGELLREFGLQVR
jgi:hypothetical protein